MDTKRTEEQNIKEGILRGIEKIGKWRTDIFGTHESEQFMKALFNGVENLRDDKEFIVNAIRRNPGVLAMASTRLKNDKEVVTEAITLDSECLQDASEELRDDEEIVLYAVKSAGYTYPEVIYNALEYASERLRNNKKVVIEAVKRGGYSLAYASAELKSDRDVVLEAVEEYGGTLQYATSALRDNKDIVMRALRKSNVESQWEQSHDWDHGGGLIYSPYTLFYASERLKDDKDVVLDAVWRNGLALKHASERLKNSKEVVLEAIKQNALAIQFASDRIKSDDYITIKTIRKSKGKVSEWDIKRWRTDPDYKNDAHFSRSSSLDLAIVPSILLSLILAIPTYGLSVVIVAFFWWREFTAFDRAIDRVDREEKEEKEEEQRVAERAKEREECRKKDEEAYAIRRQLRVEIEKMPKYSNWRNAVYEKCGRACEMCGETKGLEIHHRTSFDAIQRAYKINTIVQAFECDALWNVNNGSVLCKQCHDKMESSRHRNLHS